MTTLTTAAALASTAGVYVTYYEPTYGMRTFLTLDFAKDLEWLDAGGFVYTVRGKV